MKKSFSRFRLSRLSSFTLVELLVVMGIIAILASLILYAGGTALKAAKRAKAQNMANQIQTACLGYYTEYSIYPVGSAATDTAAQIGDTTAAKTSWGNLIYILSGNIHPSTGLATPAVTALTNSRGIAFLSLKNNDVDANDAPVNPLPTGTGASAEIYFNIAMDADYDGILGVTPSTATLPNFAGYPTSGFTAPNGGSSTAGVAVWANCNGSTSSSNANFWVKTY